VHFNGFAGFISYVLRLLSDYLNQNISPRIFAQKFMMIVPKSQWHPVSETAFRFQRATFPRKVFQIFKKKDRLKSQEIKPESAREDVLTSSSTYINSSYI